MWVAAGGSIVLSLALTPSLGLDGVALGTALPLVAVFPALLRNALVGAGLGVAELARLAQLGLDAVGHQPRDGQRRGGRG